MILHIPLKQGCKTLLYNNITQDFVADGAKLLKKLPPHAVDVLEFFVTTVNYRKPTKKEIAKLAAIANISEDKVANWVHNIRNRR